MKRSITALILAVVCLFTAACADQTEPTEPTAHTSEPTTEPVATETPAQAETTQPTVLDVPWMKLPADRTITAGQYFVYSCETGEMVSTNLADDARIDPGPATKVFTAYVALLYLPPNQIITAGKVLDKVPAEAAVAGIQKKDALTVEQLVEAMLLSDGNDAAWMLAEAAGRMMYGTSRDKVSTDTALKRFLEEMNDQAALLGMSGTRFDNPGGLSGAEQYSTCGDLAIMAMAALEDPVILRYAGVHQEEIVLPGGNLFWNNPNELLDPESQYYCEGCIGLKAGETYLLAAFEYAGQTLIVGVWDCREGDGRFQDVLQLLNCALGIS